MADQDDGVQGLSIEQTAGRTGITRHTLHSTTGASGELLATLERLRGHLAALDHKSGVYTTALEAEKESV
jgi:hypothetical protein